MTKEGASWRNAAVLLIDHQVGTMSWVKSIPVEEMKRNALMLAKTAKIMKLPTVLTSSMEDHAQGPLMKELEEVLPEEFASRILRAGIVNAMDDVNFAAAVAATGRKTLIVAGVTNDVCTVFPVLSLISRSAARTRALWSFGRAFRAALIRPSLSEGLPFVWILRGCGPSWPGGARSVMP